MTDVSLEKYKKAYRIATVEREKKGFIVHAIAYAVFNSAMIAIDLMTGPDVTWFYWPLGGWGVGLVSHYYVGLYRADRNLDEYENAAERLAEKL
jgi:hypothetical protein